MDKKNIEAIYPLTSMQQMLLLHAIQQPKQDLGFLQIQFDIGGVLDVGVLVQAWQDLLNRHQVLRTSIYWENLEHPLQMVQREVKPIWEYLDWQKLSHQEQKQKMSALKQAARQQGLSFNRAPLADVTLIQQTNDHYHFICHCHHILLDGWSSNIITTELFQLYQRQLSVTNNRLPMTFKYQHYVAWINQQDLELAKIFWKRQLKGSATKTLWPVKVADKLSNKEVLYGSQKQEIDATLTHQLQQLCHQKKITLNTLLQGIWSLLLSAYSRDDDVIYGVTVSGRNTQLEGIENAVGMFSNVLPLHSKINQRQRLVPWLQSIAVQQAEASNYDYVTLAQIQAWHTTDLRSLFVFENHAQETLFKNDDLAVSHFTSGLTTNYPLTIAIQPDKKLVINIVYDNHYLLHEQVTQLLAHWQQLIIQCIADPDQQLYSLLKEIKAADLYQQRNGNKSLIRKKVTKKQKIRPNTLTEIELAQLWKEILSLEDNVSSLEPDKDIEISSDDNFFDLGGRSIMAALLLHRIEETFQVSLPIYRLFEYPSLAKLSRFIQDQQGFKLPSIDSQSAHERPVEYSTDLLSFTRQKSWNSGMTNIANSEDGGEVNNGAEKPYLSLVPIQPQGTKPALFCIPPAGNTALTYVSLANHLGVDQPVYGLNPLGIEEGSEPQPSVKEMAAHYLLEIQRFQPKGPYYLGGTCFGGQVAFEIAQQIHAQGGTVKLLALFDPVAPYIIHYKYIIFLMKNQKSPLSLVTYIVSKLYGRLKMKFNQLTSTEQENRKPSTEKQRLEHVLNTHSYAMHHYVPQVYPGVITVFRSSQHHQLEKKGVGHFAVPWSNFTEASLDDYVIPGTHSEMITGSSLRLLTKHLKACLNKVNEEKEVKAEC